jgi:transposase
MFLKKQTRKKNGKCHTYWELVESVRTARGPRHRPVAYLGELSNSDRDGWAELARQLDDKPLPVVEPTLFDPQPNAQPVPEAVTVNVSAVRVETSRDFGDVWLALTLWRTLELDRLFADILPPGREEVGWDIMAAILAVARFCRPSSERQIAVNWYGKTSLPELLGVASEHVHEQRLYRALDALDGTKEAVEQHLAKRFGELFDLEYDLLLYDITSTYFEGDAAANPQAQRGYSRDKRGDCRQVCIGLVVTTDGLPMAFEVFDGNRNDATTIEEIVDAIEAKYGSARRIWVLDRGMVNEDNLAYIRERGGSYLVGTPKAKLRHYEQELTESDWTEVHEGLEVKLCPSPDGDETFVLCRSQARTEKEKAMHQRFSQRIQQGLEKLESRLEKRKTAPDRGKIERQIGRLLQKNSRAAGKFDIRLIDDPARPGHLKLACECKEEWSNWAALSEGAYLLRTNLTGRSPEELWRTYIQLTDAEAAFRTIKSELDLRPIYHQTTRRVHAHILVAFLAYAMWKTLQKWMQAAGVGRGMRTVVDELHRIKSCNVILPTASGREIELQCVARPDQAQRILLQHLKLRIPLRLSRPKWRDLAKSDSPCSIDF